MPENTDTGVSDVMAAAVVRSVASVELSELGRTWKRGNRINDMKSSAMNEMMIIDNMPAPLGTSI